MFEDLFDSIRMLFSWTWPTASAEITEVEVEYFPADPDKEPRLCVCYKFYVGEDGPYCGEGFWRPTFSVLKDVEEARQVMETKHTAPVRYRRDDPSQNRLDREAWRDL